MEDKPKQKVLLFITGGSRGYGTAVAREFTSKFLQKGFAVDVALLSRDSIGLHLTKEALVDQAKGSAVERFLSVFLGVVDLGDLNTLEKKISDFLSQFNPREYNQAFFVSNAGRIEKLQRASEYRSLKDFKDNFDLNVTSALYLTSTFLSYFRLLVEQPSSSKPAIWIVNISSLAGIQPMEAFSLYCAQKAARELFYKTLAAEEDPSQLKVLNWAPGMMDTGMQDDISTGPEFSGAVSFLKTLRAKGQMTPQDGSAAALFELLEKNEFKSGDHLDVYDHFPHLKLF